MLEIGKTYKDGWGAKFTVMGETRVNADWVWTVEGSWFRRADGRRIQYTLIDPLRPDGARRHVPAARASLWDLRLR